MNLSNTLKLGKTLIANWASQLLFCTCTILYSFCCWCSALSTLKKAKLSDHKKEVSMLRKINIWHSSKGLIQLNLVFEANIYICLCLRGPVHFPLTMELVKWRGQHLSGGLHMHIVHIPWSFMLWKTSVQDKLPLALFHCPEISYNLCIVWKYS